MVDSIKITALQDIGANIAYTTLVPVVNMAGTPTTQKANLQNLGNLILNGAGGSYFARAAQANIALSVANAAQPNITSVGTLTSLGVTGNITAGNINGGNIVVANFYYGDGRFLTNVAGGGSYSNSNVANYLPTYTGNVGAGNVNATGTVYTSGISSTGSASLTILNVSTTANLGAVGNITITGGTNGQKLTTNGNGVLSWTNDANSNYGNSNVANYLPTFTGTVGANRIVSNALSGSNVEINANGASFIFGEGGALYWPAGANLRVIETNIDNEFEIKSTTNVVISTDISNANLHFTFASDGVVYCPANANFEGTRLNVGPGAGNVSLTNPTLVITDTGAEFIQAAILNENSNGSSDYAAYGADSDETQGFADLGFAGHTFNDPNYTITEPGDGYVFSQGYANGIGGGLVLATGENGNVPDIVFATGGFLANNEFARIDHANDVFHLTRAGSGIKYPDGSIQTTAGGGGGSGSTLVNGDNSFVLTASGNVVFEGDVAGQGVNRGLVWDYGANANGVNSQVRQDNGGLSVRAWTTGGGGANGYSAPVNIITNQDANLKQWIFSGEGNLTLAGNLRIPAGNIESGFLAPAFNSAITGITTGNATVIVTIADSPFEGAEQGQVTISSVTGTTEANGIWYYEAVEGDQFELYTDGTYTTPVDGTSWTTYISGGTAVSTGAYSNLAIQGGNVLIKSNDQTWNFSANGALSIPNDIISNSTIDIDNRASGNSADINLYSADDIMLQARDRGTGSGSEGGDINIYAGDSAVDSDASGGDVTIEAGNGGASNIDFGGSGGFIRVQAGRGGAASTEANGFSALSGGQLTLNAGDGGDNNGNIARGANGGDVSINAGDSTGSGQTGGDIYLTTGLGGGNALAGRVQIITPSSANANGGTWTFGGDGSTIYPTLTVTRGDRTGTLTGQTLLFGDNTQEAIISTPNGDNDYINSQRFVINPGAGAADTSGEGGDIYLYAGRGGDAGGSGGDIKIRGGLAPVDGTGGYLDIQGGDTQGNGTGGYIDIRGGESGNAVGGAVNLYGGYGPTVGGNVTITGGQSGTGDGGNVTITGGVGGNGLPTYGNVNIAAGASTWKFDNTGNLVLPGNTFSVNYANGDPITFGAAALGNVTFSNVTVQGDNNALNLSAGADFTANLAYLQVRAGDVASHIHFDTGNSDAYDLYIGNDGKYVQVSSTGNIIMSSYDGNVSYAMTLDTTGNLILPNGSSIIRSVANSSLDPVNPNVSTMIFTPDPGYSSQSLVLDPTAPGHIHLRAPGTNIEEPLANIFLGGENSSFEVGYYNGSAPNVFIHSGGNTWTFDNAGNLTTPSNLVIGPTGFGGTGFTQSDAPLLFGSSEANGRASLVWFENPTGPGNIVQVGLNDSSTGSMTVTTGDLSDTTYVWDFDNAGNLILPTGSTLGYAGLGYTGLTGANNSPIEITTKTSNGNTSTQLFLNTNGNLSIFTSDEANATSYTWSFGNTGSLTAPGNIVSNGYARFSGTFDESQATSAGLYVGYAGGTPRMMFGTGNTSQTLEIDNDGGTFRFYKPGTTLANLNTSGDFATLGNITATGKIGYANGGTATQTGTGQGVTLNQLTGQITLAKSSWNVGDTEIFNISCNKVANADYVMAQVINGSEASYFNTVAYPFTAVANSIRVQVTAVVASTATPVVQFLIMKAATS